MQPWQTLYTKLVQGWFCCSRCWCRCVCVLCRVGKTSGREATTQMTTATPVLQIMLPMGRTPTQVGTSENAYLCTPAPFCWGRSWYIVWSHFVKYLLQLCQNLHHTPPPPTPPQWGTVDTEIKIPYVENPELTNALPLKSGEGQYVVWRRSVCSLACFAHCQELLPCPYFYLPGAFTFIFSSSPNPIFFNCIGSG